MDNSQEKKRKEMWSANETFKFLAIWRENNYKIKEIGPKKELYHDLATKLRAEGVEKSGEQFKKKIENMKTLYNKYKPKVTGSSPSKWMYFNQVHEILKSNHYFNQELAPIVDSGERFEEISEDMDTSSSVSTQSALSDEYLTQSGKGKSKKSLIDIIDKQSQKMDDFMQEYDRKHDQRMDELIKAKNSMQERVDVIGDRMIRVLELIENKLKND